MANRFRLTITAAAGDIDALGHVNNAVWVRWMEAVATAHWTADAAPAHVAAFGWVVTRHEIDYRGNIAAGAAVIAETFIPAGPHGARFDRRIDFTPAGADGRPQGRAIVSARSTWAMIDLASGRLLRVPAEVAAVFAPVGGWRPAPPQQ